MKNNCEMSNNKLFFFSEIILVAQSVKVEFLTGFNTQVVQKRAKRFSNSI